MGAPRFSGWPVEAVDFFAGLEADNSRAYWSSHRDRYETAVRAPFEALAAEVADEFGPLHLFRPYRDVRFSQDKSPYKTAAGAVTEGEQGEVYYVQVSAEGLLVASGYHQMAADQLTRYRAAVDDEAAGSALAAAVRQLEEGGYAVGGEALKTAPRGFPRDHPRVRLLRHKGVTAGRTFPPGPWLATRRALARVTATWRGAAPLNDWLNRHVGPSTEVPAQP
jgi:uncharacterized protein (TIGR02453 family)